MRIQELAVNNKIDEYGNAPNNSSTPKIAGGVPSAVANLKARRQAIAANQAKSATQQDAPASAAAPQAEPAATGATQPVTTTTTTPGSTKPVEPRGLLYKMGKGLVGAAGALGSKTAQQAYQRADSLERAQDFRAGPQTTTTTTAGNAAPATDTTSAQPEQPQAQQPAVDPVHAILKDPNAFKAEWDKFIASKPNYKLIADPQLLSVLKNMWMRSGGMKAESKKNKGKRV